MKPELPKRKERSVLFVPQWMVPFVWAGVVLAIQILLPWVTSKLGPRFGWSQRTPVFWNIAGRIAVVIDIALCSWCLAFHFDSYRSSVRMSFSPPSLVIGSPYRISRNPMYMSGMLVWLDGSPAVFVALLLLFSIFAFRVIPHEERQLEERFGDEYLEYKGSVHRWIGRFEVTP